MKLGAVIYTPPQSGWGGGGGGGGGGGKKGASLSPCPHLWFAVAPALIIPPEVFAAPLQHQPKYTCTSFEPLRGNDIRICLSDYKRLGERKREKKKSSY